MKKSTISEVKNKLRILEASQLFRICDAVTMTIRNLRDDKNVVIEEVVINDGLSVETIQAIQRDLRRSYALIVDHPVNQLPSKKEL